MSDNYSRFLLANVRLSYPSVYSHSSYDGVVSDKYSCKLIIPKETEACNTAIRYQTTALKEGFQNIKAKPASCLMDGDETDYDAYKNSLYLNSKTKIKPLLVDSNREPLDNLPYSGEYECFYSGCWVNAIIGYWCMNNSYGKRVACNLYGLQFVSHDTYLGDANPITPESFPA